MDALTVTREFEWIQTNWLPTPRHRKPQSRPLTAAATLRVPVLSPAEAPIAYVVANTRYDHDAGAEVPAAPTVYRVHDEQLYTQVLTHAAREIPRPVAGDEAWLQNYRLVEYYNDLRFDTESEAVHAATGKVSAYIIVDGWVWSPATEPIYEVSLPRGFYSRRGDSVRITVTHAQENNRTAEATLFPADQYAEALAYAMKLADEEGANTDLLDGSDRVEVTGAHRPGTTWRQAPRITYRSINGIQWDAPLSEWFDVLDEFRRSVAADHPDFLLDHEDGFGSTYRTIDATRLTEQQRHDYKFMLEKTADPTADWGK